MSVVHEHENSSRDGTLRQTANAQMRKTLKEMSAKVRHKQTGITEYGFPSTVNQGKIVKQVVDVDPTMENEHLVSKENYIQSSIKVHRQHMKD